MESATMPTWWPHAAWPRTRSATWRNRPPTGDRITCRILRGRFVLRLSRRRSGPVIGSEPALGDHHDVARPHRTVRRHRGVGEHAVDLAVDLDLVAVGARSVAAGNRDRVLRRHVRHIRKLTGRRHLAEHEERPVDVDLDRDLGIADIALA